MVEAFKSLQGRVPSIHEISCGKNTSDRSRGFTHGLLVRFRSQADLDEYLVHADHQRVVAEFVRPMVEEIIVVDYQH